MLDFMPPAEGGGEAFHVYSHDLQVFSAFFHKSGEAQKRCIISLPIASVCMGSPLHTSVLSVFFWEKRFGTVETNVVAGGKQRRNSSVCT